jgi:hypothetical protein
MRDLARFGGGDGGDLRLFLLHQLALSDGFSR